MYICIYGLVHDRRIPSVNGLEILQSCTNPSTCFLSRTSFHVLYWIQQTAYKYHFSQKYIIEYSLVGMANSYVGKIGKKNRSSCKNLHFYNAHFYQDNNQILFFCNHHPFAKHIFFFPGIICRSNIGLCILILSFSTEEQCYLGWAVHHDRSSAH